MRVILAGITVTAQFAFVDDEDHLQPQAQGVELPYATLTEFAAQSVGQLREAWEQLRHQANAPATADPPPDSQ